MIILLVFLIDKLFNINDRLIAIYIAAIIDFCVALTLSIVKLFIFIYKINFSILSIYT